MSEMSILRKEDLSLYSYIKESILRNFVELDLDVPLALMPDLCSYDSYVYQAVTSIIPSPVTRGRGWLYFDTVSSGTSCDLYTDLVGLNGDGDSAMGLPEQSDMVTIYENTTTISGTVRTIVSGTEYMIDYVDGRIITERKLVNPTVDYFWHYVSIVDEWAAIQAADPPVIVIDMYGTDKTGYQLGGGRKSTRKVDIHIFASDPAERNDLVETIYNGVYLKSCKLLDFKTGTALDYDGTFYGRRDLDARYDAGELNVFDNKLTYLYDRAIVENISRLYFDNVSSRHVSLPLIMTRGKDEAMLSDLNAYRAKVSFDLYCYDDRSISV